MQATRPCRTPIGRGRRLTLAVLAALPLILIASTGPGVPTLAAPGPYQLYVDTLIKDVDGEPQHLVLRRQVTVPGSYQLSPVGSAPSLSGTADGYTITFNANKITTMDGTHLTNPKGWTVMY